MKLLIIALLIAVTSATWMRSNQRFMQIIKKANACETNDAGFKPSMCGCQGKGCSYDSTAKSCLKILDYKDKAHVHTAGILGGCNDAQSQTACETHVAWTNRFGGKTDCAWCSGVCVRSGIADNTCSFGKGYSKYLGGEPTAPTTPRPKPTPKPTPTEEKTKEKKNIDEAIARVKKNGGLDPAQAKFSITLTWEGCNDLDIWLGTPTGMFLGWSTENKKLPDGAWLDIDMNAQPPMVQKQTNDTSVLAEFCKTHKPVENIRYKDDGKAVAPGIYKVIVHFYQHHLPQGVRTPYTLLVKTGGKWEQYSNDPDSFGPEENDDYYVKIQEDGKSCVDQSLEKLAAATHKCA